MASNQVKVLRSKEAAEAHPEHITTKQTRKRQLSKQII